jgi:hypothetical protein
MVLSTVVLLLVTAVLIVAQRTTHFTQGQSISLDDARLTLQQVGRDIQNAHYIDWCASDGTCLEVGTFSPTDEFRWYRYEVAGNELRRVPLDEDGEEVGTASTIMERLANGTGEPVFACDLDSTLLRVNLHFRVQPTPQSSPSYELATSVRPRNFGATAQCP